jgi:lysozyme family protein
LVQPAQPTERFREALRLLDVAEGGFSNRPSDPGGPTFRGVSWRAVCALDEDKDGQLDFDLDHDGDVDAEDIRALEGHPEMVEEFYLRKYWHPVHGNDVPWPWSYALFDAAVLHGPEAAVVFLQRALSVKSDGTLGPNTLGALAKAGQGTLVRFVHERLKLCYRLSVKRGDLDGTEMFNGWSKRLIQLEAYCLEDLQLS